jgi:hypothetical protein
MSEPTRAEQDRLDVMGRSSLKALGFDEALARKVKQRIEEGLDATVVKDFQYEGHVVSGPARVDHNARHKFTELTAKIFDWQPSKIEHEVHGEVGLKIIGLDLDGV